MSDHIIAAIIIAVGGIIAALITTHRRSHKSEKENMEPTNIEKSLDTTFTKEVKKPFIQNTANSKQRNPWSNENLNFSFDQPEGLVDKLENKLKGFFGDYYDMVMNLILWVTIAAVLMFVFNMFGQQ